MNVLNVETNSSQIPSSSLNTLHIALLKLAEVNPTMPVSQSIAFLTVVKNEGRSLAELAKVSHIKQSTMSRYLLDLSNQGRSSATGHGLIRRETDPHELRRNMYTLTPKGRKLVQELIGKE